MQNTSAIAPGALLLSITPDEFRRAVREELNAVLAERFPEEGKNHADDVPVSTADLLTVNETAKLLHVSRVTLFKWEHRKTLIPCRIGRRVLYRKADVEAALKRGRVTR